MAVYTEVPAEELQAFLARYDTGELVSAKGIAEGVSNSNFLIETSSDRYILTLYERRIDIAELPWFISLMEHLAGSGLPVPCPIRDRNGEALQKLAGKTACLIQFLPGVSVSHPTAAQARAAGAALARLHLAGRNFPEIRENGLGPNWWREASTELGEELNRIEHGLAEFVQDRMRYVVGNWPKDLPAGIIHADLFPDNVLMLGDRITGLIDFYFACSGLFAYDLAVLHAAWVFPPDGTAPLSDHADALFDGYESVRPLEAAEREQFALLGQGAALRFLLSRAQDWLAPHSDALVQRKDPLPFVRRLKYYASIA